MEEINPQEFIDKIKAHEERLRHIEAANQVEYELQNTIVLPLIIDVAKKEADEALTELAVVDPSDCKKIIALQAKIYCSRMLTEILIAIRKRGAFASQEIQAQAEAGELPDGEDSGEG